ncbi:MAG: 6-pyruvoyl-tetrahydropterin synthase-related protein, partial [Planctomycetota bacterium]
APVVWLNSLPAAYNTYLFLAIILNCSCGYMFLRQTRCSILPALFGGLAIGLHPLALSNLEAIQLVPLWGILLTLGSILRLHQTPNAKSTVMLAASFIITVMLCIHHALFLALLLPVCLATLSIHNTKKQRHRFAVALAIAALLCTICIGPFLWQMHQAHNQEGFDRSLDSVRVLSASWRDWTPSACFVSFENLTGKTLLPGWLRLCLAVAAILLTQKRRRATNHFLVGLTVCSILFSFGANIAIGDWSLWESVSSFLSPLSRVRSPYRFAYFAQLGVLLLAAHGVNELFRRRQVLLNLAQRNRKFAKWKFLVTPACALASIILCFEVPPPKNFLSHPPLQIHSPAWVEFVKTNSEPTDSLLCLPVCRDASEWSHETSTRWMLYGVQHQRPILNGYSGFAPKTWIKLRKELRKSKWPPDVFSQLREKRTKFIVVNKDTNRVNLQQYTDELKQVADYDRFSVWQLTSKPVQPHPEP